MNEAKGEWIKELKRLDLYPEMEILELIEPSPTGRQIAAEREEYWIQEYLCLCAPLLNI